MISEVNKKRLLIITITIIVIFIIYQLFGNTNYENDNVIENIGVLNIVYNDRNNINISNKELKFAISNQSNIPIGYQIIIELNNISDKEFDNLEIYVDSNLLEDKLVSKDQIVITTNYLSKQYSKTDKIEHSIRIEGLTTSSATILINDIVANNLLTDYINIMNYEGNGEGLETISNNIKYTNQYSKNYIEFNNELWQIIGIFEYTQNQQNELFTKITRVKPATDEEKISLDELYYNNLIDKDKVAVFDNIPKVEAQSAKDCVEADWLDFSNIKPTLYLNSNITIIEGNGSINDPYVIK